MARSWCGEGVCAFSFHHLLCVYVDSTSPLTACSIGAVYYSAGDQTGRIGRAGVHDHPRDFDQLAAERQGRNGFPKAA
jgi:hypothetical protein